MAIKSSLFVAFGRCTYLRTLRFRALLSGLADGTHSTVLRQVATRGFRFARAIRSAGELSFKSLERVQNGSEFLSEF
mgnify:CR=1 FL=1